MEGRGWWGEEVEGAGSAVLGKVVGALCRPRCPEQRLGAGAWGWGSVKGWLCWIPLGAGRRDLLNDAF